MFENIGSFFKKIMKNDTKELVSDTTLSNASKEAAKERLQLVLMQDRANVSADFLELMKQEIVDVIKKYIVVEEDIIDVRIINQENEDGTQGAPSLCANIPILNIRNDNKGEKFRSEQSQVNTKEDTTKEVVEESINNSNDNVEIENNVEEKTDVNIKNEIVEISEEKVEDIVKEDKEINEEIVEIEEFEQIENVSAEEPEEVKEETITSEIDEVDNYDDEDDEDVTFDDLLKAAEEEEKNQKAAKEVAKINNKKSTSKSKNGKSSKNHNKRKQTNKK